MASVSGSWQDSPGLALHDPSSRPWMNSPEHGANILSRHFGDIGAGMYVSGARVYTVEDFTN
jgi:hypothetical protein